MIDDKRASARAYAVAVPPAEKTNKKGCTFHFRSRFLSNDATKIPLTRRFRGEIRDVRSGWGWRGRHIERNYGS